LTGIEAAGAIVATGIGAGLLAAFAGFVSRRTALDVDGDVVPQDVEGLANRAGKTVAVYALARVGSSEAGGQPRIAKAAVMWVVMNEANRRGVSVLAVILGSAGGFGAQGSGGRNFVSSAKDPQVIDFGVAEGVADGSIEDPTGGALNFDSPRGYADPARADTFAENRQAEGKELVTLEGVKETTFRFWRPA
jgi:Cell Wall Hydrolase